MFFSVGIMGVAFFINPEIEKRQVVLNSQGEEQAPQGFWPDLKQNLRDIYAALKIPMINRAVLFFFLSGVIVPSFSEISYYFQLNVVMFSKFTISMLTLLSYITLLSGTMLYQRCFKDSEVRTMMKLNIIISFFAVFINLLFALRINVALGINDLFFIVFTNIITDTLNLAFS